MRIPIKSEADAFRLVYAFVFLVGVSVVLGAIFAPAVGIALCVGGILGGGLLAFERTDPEQMHTLSAAAHSLDRERSGLHRRRILVVANQTVGGEELKREILTRGAGRPELRIVAPVLSSRVHYLASDIDGDIREAGARLDATLRWASEEGLEAVGTVTEATPLQAIEDELRRYPADELIISTHVPERSHWLEAGVVERASAELDIPVTHVIVDVARQRVTVSA
jgi:GABA permease